MILKKKNEMLLFILRWCNAYPEVLNMFQDYETKDFVNKNFVNLCFDEDVSITNRVFWEKVKEGLSVPLVISESDFCDFKLLTATMYMQFDKTGNRTVYEEEYFKRRKALIYYTFMEAIENKGKNTNIIIDLVWMIMEETVWAVPSHAILSQDSDALCDYNDEILDVFSAETGALLGFVYRVMNVKFDEISKNINPMIIKKLNTRIISSYLTHEHYGWMGFDGNRVNNWNPWINSNVLKILPLCSNSNTNELIIKLMKSIDNFADQYPDDGACEEGIMYWYMSGISLAECIYYIYIYSNKKINLFTSAKIKNTLKFYQRVYISNGRVVNFSDSHSKYVCDYGVILFFAKLSKDSELIDFCKEMYDKFNNKLPIDWTKPERAIYLAKANNCLKDYKSGKVSYATEFYFDSIQVYIKRMSNGIFFAAKGGHNDEAHNHNDIGNFIVYKNGIPFIIDSGNMMYTKDTFSKRRYTIWTNRSEYHNLPQIQGINQKNGAEFKAKNIVHNSNEFSLDIASAYDDDNIVKWNRKFTFDDEKLFVTEKYELKRESEIILNFLVAVKPSLNDDGIRLNFCETHLDIKFDLNKSDVDIEKIAADDPILKLSWDDFIYRIKIKKKENTLSGTIIYCIF